MSIICGVDFSPGSSKATHVAAQLAARRREPMVLAHALTGWPGEIHPDEKMGVLTAACRAVEREATEARQSGADVRARVELGTPLSALAKQVKEEGAELLVVGASGAETSKGNGVGRTADRLAQKAQVPTLVVRDSEPFEQWFLGQKPLTVLVGLDFNAASDQAWRWALQLRGVGKVNVIGVHVYWPPEAFHRLGLSGMRNYLGTEPEVEQVLRREIDRRFTADGPFELVLSAGIGRHGDHLLKLASERGADLIVVGSHARSNVQRLWEGSVSRTVLHYAKVAVALVPPLAQSEPRAAPSARAVVAATDFSPAGDAAVAAAYSQVGPGGVVHLLHVVSHSAQRSEWEPHDIFMASAEMTAVRRAAEEKLRARVPTQALLDEKRTELCVLESRDPAQAIAQAAERIGAEVICVGTRGRSGLAKTLLGSVAQGVIAQTERPVLLVRAPR
ncbi:MAG: universal stress protein [Myxococcaceae bacterium]|nr:universal stress protein [Myxococcaceae bacterium]